MMNDDFVGALAILLIFGAPIAAWITTRVLQHNERMEMIRRGMVPPPGPMPRSMPPPTWHPGPMPPPNVAGKGYPAYDDYYYAQRQMRKGITLAFIGFAIFIGLGSIGPLAHLGFAGPWLLGGLIPMFVGIAQVVNAWLNGARIPGFTPGAYGPPHSTFVPPPGGGSSAPQPPPAGPYAWRPGSTPEIERPVPPPDQRT
ncbi:MAG TPA: DUF6249 domain-containing protein [Verrucomicrobiae bacterium]|nr:DUF6249 domain-containing protein [Verrucomicrobiae bacterium]